MVGQRAGRHCRQRDVQYRAGAGRGRRGGAGGQDGAHVIGGEPAELHRPAQRRCHGIGAVRVAQGSDRGDVRGQPDSAGGGRGAQERLRLRAEARNACSAALRGRTARRGRRAGVS